MTDDDDFVCYLNKVASCSGPNALSNVDATYVLTMTDSTRKLNEDLICKLTPRMYIQYNKGFKRCDKPGVTHTGQDIIHAYKHIASSVLSNTDFKAVLILEDDSILTEDTFKHLPYVDDFIAKNEFDVYSLCSLGVMFPYGLRHRIIVGTCGSCNAVIWSRSALQKLSDTPVADHIDVDVIGKFKLKFTYWKPLITQTFPDTENSKNWGGTINFGHLRFLGLRSTPQPGWNIIYTVCGPLLWTVIGLVIVVVCNATRRLARRRKCDFASQNSRGV